MLNNRTAASEWRNQPHLLTLGYFSLAISCLLIAYQPTVMASQYIAPEYLSPVPLLCIALALKSLLSKKLFSKQQFSKKLFSKNSAINNNDIWILLGLTSLLCIPSYQVSWLVLCLLGLLLVNRGEQALGSIIALAAFQPILATFSLKFFANSLLSFDAWLLFQLLSVFHDNIAQLDNLLTGPAGHQLLVLRGCSSLTNLSTAYLLCFTLFRLNKQTLSRCELIVVLALTTSLLLLNLARLYMMAIDLSWHEWWHSHNGQTAYQTLFWLITFSAVLFIKNKLLQSRPDSHIS